MRARGLCAGVPRGATPLQAHGLGTRRRNGLALLDCSPHTEDHLYLPRDVTIRSAVFRVHRAGVSRGAALRQLVSLIVVLCGLAGLGCESWFIGAPEYASVSVLATDSSGTGIPGVSLELYTGARVMGYGVTDPSGQYVFTDVPPGGYGVLLLKPALYKDPDEPAGTTVDQLLVAARTVQPVHFTLARCHGVIDATVTEITGASAEGVNLLFYTGLGPLDTLQTDALGKRSFAVDCGQYGVKFADTFGYTSPAGPNSSFADGLVVHRDGHVSAALKVQRCLGALRVTVLDAANAPVPAASLVTYTSTANLYSGLTGADGRYTFERMPCGTDVGVAVGAPTGYRVIQGRGTSFVDGLRMANNDTLDVTFHLAAP